MPLDSTLTPLRSQIRCQQCPGLAPACAAVPDQEPPAPIMPVASHRRRSGQGKGAAAAPRCAHAVSACMCACISGTQARARGAHALRMGGRRRCAPACTRTTTAAWACTAAWRARRAWRAGAAAAARASRAGPHARACCSRAPPSRCWPRVRPRLAPCRGAMCGAGDARPGSAVAAGLGQLGRARQPAARDRSPR